MASSLDDILKRRVLDEPAEIAAVKNFVKTKFKTEVSVAVKPGQIIILASSAALAGALRPHLNELEQKLKTDKKLVIRIG